MWRNRWVGLLFCFVPCLALGAPTEEEATRLTDPAQLMRMGFPADARNVYMAKGAMLGPSTIGNAPKEFGTLDPEFTTVSGVQHHSRTSGVHSTALGEGDIYAVSGDTFYDAQIQMPEGALWNAAKFFVFDNVPEVLGFSVLRTCEPGSTTILSAGDSLGAVGAFTFTFFFPPITVDNVNCFYTLRTRFDAYSVDLRLNKVWAQWQRQVSPSPAVATFPNDVPTTHPFFRFVEALAAAGITSGCGPGSYCPDAPLTRGQMAVFLSAALGLHWP